MKMRVISYNAAKNAIGGKMPGPAPMPTRIKLLTGNRGKRPINDREPEPELKIPNKPAHITGIAATEWKRITVLLHSLGLLTEIDRTAIEGYCQYYKQWRESVAAIDAGGYVIETSTGYPMQNPHVSIANKAFENMRKMLIEFGMTPSSRSRVKLPEKKKKDTGFSDI